MLTPASRSYKERPVAGPGGIVSEAGLEPARPFRGTRPSTVRGCHYTTRTERDPSSRCWQLGFPLDQAGVLAEGRLTRISQSRPPVSNRTTRLTRTGPRPARGGRALSRASPYAESRKEQEAGAGRHHGSFASAPQFVPALSLPGKDSNLDYGGQNPASCH